MFETDRLPAGWLKKLSSMDEVWVPSEFMKSIFEKGGATNVRVVGESVDTHLFRPIPSVRWQTTVKVKEDSANDLAVSRAKLVKEVFQPHPTAGWKTHILLSVFKWEMRKGWDILLDVYLHTFTREDSVSLFIVTQEYHESGRNQSGERNEDEEKWRLL